MDIEEISNKVDIYLETVNNTWSNENGMTRKDQAERELERFLLWLGENN